MAEETEHKTEHHEPLTTEDRGDKKVFSKAWMHKHWVELAALGVGVLGLLFFYLRSKSTSASGVYSPPTSPSSTGAGTGAGGGSGNTSPVDLSGITDALAQQAQQESAFEQQILAQDQSNAEAAAQAQEALRSELQAEMAALTNQNQQAQQGFLAAIAALTKQIAGNGGSSSPTGNPLAPPTPNPNTPPYWVGTPTLPGSYPVPSPGYSGYLPTENNPSGNWPIPTSAANLAGAVGLTTASTPPPPPPPPAAPGQALQAAGVQVQQARQGVKNLASAAPKPKLSPGNKSRGRAAQPL